MTSEQLEKGNYLNQILHEIDDNLNKINAAIKYNESTTNSKSEIALYLYNQGNKYLEINPKYLLFGLKLLRSQLKADREEVYKQLKKL